MRALVMDRHGRMQPVRQPRPEPGPGELLVRVLATTVNRHDLLARRNNPDASAAHPVPGCDLAGVVEARGSGVEGMPPGLLVAASARPFGPGYGTYAEWAVVPAAHAAPVPDGVPPEAAACVAFAGLAAYQGMYAIMPEAGEVILVNGAAGGVGTFAIQIARRDRARVVCNARPTAAALCHALGAEWVVDSRAEDMAAAIRRSVPAGVNGELDLLDGATEEASLRAMARRGRLVSLVAAPAAPGTITAWQVNMQPDGQQLVKLLDLCAAGQLRAVVADTVQMRHAAAAHDRLEQGGVLGKLVLSVSDRP